MKTKEELVVRFVESLDDYMIVYPVRFEKGHFINLDHQIKIYYKWIENYSFILRHNWRKFAVAVVLGGMIIFTLIFLSHKINLVPVYTG